MAAIIDPATIAKAVQAEIERQQTAVTEDMSIEDLSAVIKHLEAKLAQCQSALARKSGGSCCPPGGAMGACCNSCATGGSSFVSLEPALRAAKSAGTWPDLPWTDRALPPTAPTIPAATDSTRPSLSRSRCVPRSCHRQAGRRQDHGVPHQDDE